MIITFNPYNIDAQDFKALLDYDISIRQHISMDMFIENNNCFVVMGSTYNFDVSSLFEIVSNNILIIDGSNVVADFINRVTSNFFISCDKDGVLYAIVYGLSHNYFSDDVFEGHYNNEKTLKHLIRVFRTDRDAFDFIFLNRVEAGI
ncbi:MAG: hypothetical protein FWE02_04445 [Defluviitaleaceae bacterium]|nr:hypothetical protein [Defluviitaleaceae bacterium]